MRLDDGCEEVLRRVAAWKAPETPTVAEARALDLRRKRELGDSGPHVFEARRVTMVTESGALGAVAYRPTEQAAPGLLVWLHGGGWVVGSADNSDDQARALAVSSGCVVLSVDYRLAPEHPFPRAVLDALEAVAWASARADQLGAVPGRLAIGGDSAGGNVAAAAALMARDHGGPSIDFQLLVPGHVPGLRQPLARTLRQGVLADRRRAAVVLAALPGARPGRS